ncbi:Uncharacterised protein [Neisseria meningitidis]|nr:Uncharacterised protein [Neisseria meningitidis]
MQFYEEIFRNYGFCWEKQIFQQLMLPMLKGF